MCYSNPGLGKIVRYILVAIAVIMATIALAGCGNSRDARLVGTWYRRGAHIAWRLELLRDGSGTETITHENWEVETHFSWSTSDSQLTLTIYQENADRIMISDFTISSDGSTLTIYSYRLGGGGTTYHTVEYTRCSDS